MSHDKILKHRQNPPAECCIPLAGTGLHLGRSGRSLDPTVWLVAQTGLPLSSGSAANRCTSLGRFTLYSDHHQNTCGWVGFIAGRQKLGSADTNFWKELDACRRLVAERTAQGGVFTVHRVPSVYDQVATAFVPFDVRRKISDDSFWVDAASAPLLNAALDAAARVADGIKRKKAELTTDLAMSRIAAEMKRVLS